MSYSKIKNISIKKDKVTITSAESNVYPITYYAEEWKWASGLLCEGKREELIGEICRCFLDGSFHSANDAANRKFLYALTLNREEIDRLQEIRWGWNSEGIPTREHTQEERQAATEQLVKLLYRNYLLAEQADKEHRGEKYYIELDFGYLCSVTRRGITYTMYRPTKFFDFLVASALVGKTGYQKHISAEYNPTLVKVA